MDWTTIQQRLQWGYHEPHELIVAMTFTAQIHQLNEIGQELKVTPEQEMVDMVDGCYLRLSRHMRGELERLFGKHFFQSRLEWVMKHVLIEDGGKSATVEAWIEAFRATPAGVLLAALVSSVYHDPANAWLDGHPFQEAAADPALLQRLVQTHPLPDEQEREELTDILRFPEEYKLRALAAIEQFHAYAFTPIRQRLRELGDYWTEHYRAIFEAQPERAWRDLAKMEPGLVDRTTRVHVSYFSQARYDFQPSWVDGHPHWLLLGACNERLAWQRADKEEIELFLKVIADKRRLELIERLQERSRYGSELAHAMGLTPAAITHHMNLLLSVSLIRLVRQDNRVYYDLDRARLRYLLAQVQNILLP